MSGNEGYDEVGYWSEVKLDIVREYLNAYSTIISAQRNPSFSHVYIDGFSGPGVCISKTRDDYIPGSPLNALNVTPPFREFYFIDMDGGKATELRRLCEDRPDVHILEGNCNELLVDERCSPKSGLRTTEGLCVCWTPMEWTCAGTLFGKLVKRAL